jgi:hypothetical protein
MSVALAWLLQRSPNMLLSSGTSAVEHLRENGADGISDVEGKVARVAMSELGNERISMLLALKRQIGLTRIKC